MDQFIFKKSDKTIWHIYHDSTKRTILLQSFNSRRGMFNEPILNINNAQSPIACNMDSKDNIQIAFPNKNGDIYFGTFNGSKITHFPILVSKNPTSYDKNLSIATTKGRAFIFYTLESKDKTILSMQEALPDRKISTPPLPIDYLSPATTSYKVIEVSDYIYITYIKDTNSKQTLGFRIYSLQTNTLSNFIEIPSVKNKPHNIDSCLIDTDDTLVIFASDNIGIKEIRVNYITKITQDIMNNNISSNSLTTSILKHEPLPDLKDCFYSALQISNIRYIYYCYVSQIYFFKSVNGNDYGSIEKYDLNNGRYIMPIFYKSNDEQESSLLNNTMNHGGFILPGRLSGIIQMYFFNPFLPLKDQKSNNLDIDTAMFESIKLLKSEVNRLDEIISQLSKRIRSIENSYDKFEQDMTKLELQAKLSSNFQPSLNANVTRYDNFDMDMANLEAQAKLKSKSQPTNFDDKSKLTTEDQPTD